MFDANYYRQRRATLLNAIGDGVILLLGNELSPKNYADNTYPFRQDSTFLYYLGWDEPHAAALLDGATGTTTLFADAPTMMEVVWMGAKAPLAERVAAVGIEAVEPFDQLPAALAGLRQPGRELHFLPPYRPENQIRLHQWLELSLAEIAAGASVRLIQAVVAQRSIKTPPEILELEAAVNTTRAMHLAVMQQARAGMTEAQLAGIAASLALAGGGDLAYSIILTTRGQVLHNHEHHHVLKAGQLVLGDFGAETARHYAGDITRTFPVDPTFSTQQRDLYQLVLDVQMAAIAAIRPGVSYRSVHLQAALQLTAGLIDLGLMQGDAEEAVAAGAHALFFPHGLGHLLGLDVHDMEDLGEDRVGYGPGQQRSAIFGLRSLRLARVLEEGMVLTVEPGIYFIPPLIDQWAAEHRHRSFINYAALEPYRNFTGIRIEDNVLVTATGQRVLGEPIPKTVAEIEALRQG